MAVLKVRELNFIHFRYHIHTLVVVLEVVKYRKWQNAAESLATSRPPLLKIERTVTVESMCSSFLRRVPSKSEYMLLLILRSCC